MTHLESIAALLLVTLCGPLLAEEAPVGGEALALDFDAAVQVELPIPKDVGDHLHFTAPDGREGWVARISDGNRRTMTPGFGEGRVFAGANVEGHSHLFAFEPASGKKVWSVKLTIASGGSGIHAPVVAGGLVVTATTFGSLRAHETTTGEEKWNLALVEYSTTRGYVPMASDPAIADGLVYFAYPQKGNEKRKSAFTLICVDLETGKQKWKIRLGPAEVISAPVVAGERIYVTGSDGSIQCLDRDTGRRYWGHRYG